MLKSLGEDGAQESFNDALSSKGRRKSRKHHHHGDARTKSRAFGKLDISLSQPVFNGVPQIVVDSPSILPPAVGCESPASRRLARAMKASLQEPQADDRSTWPERWLNAFVKTASAHSQVPVGDLSNLLKEAGHRNVWENIVHEVQNQVSKYKFLSDIDTFHFLSKYEQRVEDDLREAFLQRLSNDGNTITFAALEEIVNQMGYTPLPHSLSEIIEEAVYAIRENQKSLDKITYPTFNHFVSLLVEREGFSQSEALEFERAFIRADNDGSRVLEVDEMQPILVWLGFCSEPHIVAELMKDVSSDGIDLKGFMLLMRKHRAVEYTHTARLFKKHDSRKCNSLQPRELVLVFKELGLSLLPATLVEVVEDCGLSFQEFSFSAFWKVLQLLRLREGFTCQELKDISESFPRFDPYHSKQILTRNVPDALRWMGYLLGKAANDENAGNWREEYGARTSILEAEFVKICRDHAEADLRSVRAAFRYCSEDGGVSPLPMARLPTALARLNVQYTHDYVEWLRLNMPSKFEDMATLDFEDFRTITTGLREGVRERLRDNYGFTEKHLTKFRVHFAKQMKKENKSNMNDSLTHAGLAAVFKGVCPIMEQAPEIHVLVKKAMQIHVTSYGALDWMGFLKVMRTYEELLEEELTLGMLPVRDELNLHVTQIDEFMNVYELYLHCENPRELGVKSMKVLYKATQGSADISDDQASKLMKHFVHLQDVDGVAGNIDKFITLVKKLGEFKLV